jgi:tetratricopeptide (TPR) repeat protein
MPSRNRYDEAVALLEADRLADAGQAFRDASRIAPADVGCLVGLGIVLRKQGRFAEAAATHRRALTLQPGLAAIWSNLGNALKDMGDVDGAIMAHSRAAALEPGNAAFQHNLGIALTHCGRHREALIHFDRGLVSQPDNIDIRWDLALALLATGDFARGFPAYELRWHVPWQPIMRVEGREWDGSPFPGRRLLLYCEQGMGDSLLCLRFLPRVLALGGEVVVECQAPLLPLAAEVAGAARIIAQGDKRPDFDLCLSLMSLPRLFVPGPASLCGRPYLRVPIDRKGSFDHLFANAAGMFKLGIVWSGSATFRNNHIRAVALETLLRAVCGIPGIKIYSLQKGPQEAELHALPPGHGIIDLAPHLRDFGDTAEIVSRLDLVVMTDTAIAHLCGALGRPVWVLLGANAYWLWQEAREDSPWYDSIRLFRQERAGDWQELMSRVRAALVELPARREAASGFFGSPEPAVPPEVREPRKPGRRSAGRGILYIPGTDPRSKALLDRSLRSLRRFHPELPVEEAGPVSGELSGKGGASRARMLEFSPFVETLFLDPAALVLGRLDYGFDTAGRFGLACCLSGWAWARRHSGAAAGDRVAYDTGVVFFTATASSVFARWRDLVEDGQDEESAFATAVAESGFSPFILPANWNFRPDWHRSFCGPLKIWQDEREPPAEILALGEVYRHPEAVIERHRVDLDGPREGLTRN